MPKKQLCRFGVYCLPVDTIDPGAIAREAERTGFGSIYFCGDIEPFFIKGLERPLFGELPPESFMSLDPLLCTVAAHASCPTMSMGVLLDDDDFRLGPALADRIESWASLTDGAKLVLPLRAIEQLDASHRLRRHVMQRVTQARVADDGQAIATGPAMLAPAEQTAMRRPSRHWTAFLSDVRPHALLALMRAGPDEICLPLPSFDLDTCRSMLVEYRKLCTAVTAH